MSFNDPIAELLTKIRNAKGASLLYVDVSFSKIKLNIVKILKEKGFIESYLADSDNNRMRIFLKYNAKRQAVIRGIKRVSTPGHRIYVGYENIPQIFGGIGTVIVSTSKGVMDDVSAKQMKMGGELLCYVW